MNKLFILKFLCGLFGGVSLTSFSLIVFFFFHSLKLNFKQLQNQNYTEEDYKRDSKIYDEIINKLLFILFVSGVPFSISLTELFRSTTPAL